MAKNEAVSATYNETWRDRTRRRMRALGLKQEDLCSALGVRTRGAVGHYLAGRRQLAVDQAVKLSRVLQCSMDWLFLGEGWPGSPTGQQRSTGRSGNGQSRRYRQVPSVAQLLAALEALPPQTYAKVAGKVGDLLDDPATDRDEAPAASKKAAKKKVRTTSSGSGTGSPQRRMPASGGASSGKRIPRKSVLRVRQRKRSFFSGGDSE